MSRRDEREILRRLSERRSERGSERGESEPPADLLERLRAEIPATVRVHQNATGQESGRRPSPRQRWLLAASLAAMVGMGLFSLHVLKSGEEEEKAPARASTATPPPAGRPAPPAPAAVTPPQASAKLQYQLEVAPPAKPRERERADSAGAPEGARRSVSPEPAPAAPAAAPPPQESAGGIVGGVPGGFAGSAGATAGEAEADRQAAPEPAAKSAARPMAKVAQPARGENRAYLLARSGPPAEGAPAPLAGDAPRWLLLFRLESVALSPGAHAEVAFDPAVVTGSRRVGEGTDLLYEVTLQPGAAAETTVASLQSVSLGAPPRLLRTLRVADLTPAWEQASTGFRLTSLAAELAEVLAGTRPRSALPELLRRARGLAAELPGDSRAADLLYRIEQTGTP